MGAFFGLPAAILGMAKATLQAIKNALMTTDDDYLYISRQMMNPPRSVFTRIGWVHLVYGNEGWTVIRDYTVNLEKAIPTWNEIDELIEKYDALVNGTRR